MEETMDVAGMIIKNLGQDFIIVVIKIEIWSENNEAYMQKVG